MQSGRLRLIYGSLAVAATCVGAAALTAGATASGTLGDEGPLGAPPTTLSCETQPGPVMQTIEYARCQTVAVVDGVAGWTCEATPAC